MGTPVKPPAPTAAERRRERAERFSAEIARQEAVRSGFAQKHRTLLSGLAMLGIVGWSVAIPTLAGVAAGVWFDRRWPSQYSFTLMFLFAGVVLGCLNAWYWVQKVGKNMHGNGNSRR